MWQDTSNFIAVLSIKNEAELIALIKRLDKKEIKYATFRESDFQDELTAIAIEPGEKGKKMTSSLPLALKRCEVAK